MGSGPRLTIGVLAQKGGVGKTTQATNLGAAAVLSGLRTIGVDLDPQGSFRDWRNARPPGSRLAGLDVKPVREELTEAVFRQVTAGYDVAILDGAPRLNDVTRLAAMHCDVVLVLVGPGVFDWWATEETLALLDLADAARAKLRPPRGPVRRVFALNKALPRTRIGKAAREAVAQLGEAVCIEERVHYVAASAAGESVLTFTDRELPRGVKRRDPPAAVEMQKLWRLLSTPVFGDAHD